ncbi:glycosyltransferase family 1 protein [Mycobacterium sp. CBMA271]|uniref:glycosyltransferase n=1 Tax=unclassified Mycobacteroides TaxID=2618759 RepID=UPI00132A590D|nr:MULTISPECIES: glycosyltransferase [unclassified Mycobacteroides]MUM18465.1 glycosyltransferase [Mycobacteroides sp. CBMA 326]MUM23734.1 glycosyltransferase family 1 protein [Mycobacteroides sp. CBMA 271]
MTTIVIAAYGTRGDVAPLTGLGIRLRDSLSARVVIAAQHPYARLVQASGLEFRVLPGDTQTATRASEHGQALVDGARLRPSRPALDEMRAGLAGVGEAMADTARDADVLLAEGPVGTLLGYHVAEALGIPSAGLSLQPACPTADFAPPPLTTRSFGGRGNRMVWRVAESAERIYTPLIDDLRHHLGLARSSRGSYHAARARHWPIVHGYSHHLVERPRDWRSHWHLAGYWWPHHDETWLPSQELTEFIDSGPAPVFVGFGSTATAKGPELSETLATAIGHAGVRAVVQRGWAGLSCDDNDVLTVDDVPHSWLFPRMAAVVHHCGAGTTAAALRAGVPSIPVPGIMDQPFWADRLSRLGAACTPLPRTTLRADELSAAITAVITESRYRQEAQRLSRLVCDEDGAGAAVDIIASLLDATTTKGAHHGH